MRLSHVLRAINVALAAAVCLCAQEPTPQSKDARPGEAQGLPPRVAPTDYQAQAKAGEVTIAAEFAGHGVPTASQDSRTIACCASHVTVDTARASASRSRSASVAICIR